MELSEDHKMFRESVRGFIEKEISPYVEEWEERRCFPAKELFRKIGDEGFFGLKYSPSYEGLGLEYIYTYIWADELGKIACGGIPMSLSVQSDMCTPALSLYGSEYLKEEYLKPAIRGEKIGAIAITEPETGSDISSIKLTAVSNGDSYTLNGTKSYITNGGTADFIVTLCKTSSNSGLKNFSLIVVPKDSKGLSVSKTYSKLGNFSCNHSELTFTNVVVPKEHVIGEEGDGFTIQLEQFNYERLIIGIISLSQSKTIMEKTKKYVKNREVFNKPMIDQQHIAFILVDLEMEITSLERMIYHSIDLISNEKECTKEVAMVKLKSSKLLRNVADNCLQLFGGYGYMEESGMPRYLRDTRSVSIAGGTDEIMKHLLKRYL